ncbi:MAG: hypothetical protein HOI66_16945 [Verrucomicrobia bacterium]|nr:hypothetical protein [Verrucomicrobiota bacterium]
MIMVFGLVGVVAFGSLGFWNQSHPLFVIRNSLEKTYKVKVSGTELLKDEKGVIYGINFRLLEQPVLSPDTCQEMAQEIFLKLLKEQPENKLQLVRVTEKSMKTHDVPRIHALAFQRLERNVDRIKLSLLNLGFGEVQFEVLGLRNAKIDVRILVRVTEAQLKSRHTGSNIAKRIQSRKNLTIGNVEVRLIDKAGKEQKVQTFPAAKSRK